MQLNKRPHTHNDGANLVLNLYKTTILRTHWNIRDVWPSRSVGADGGDAFSGGFVGVVDSSECRYARSWCVYVV